MAGKLPHARKQVKHPWNSTDATNNLPRDWEVGIDLGTTNSSVAIKRPDGRAEVLPNEEGCSPATIPIPLIPSTQAA